MSSDAEKIIDLYERRAPEWIRDRALRNSLFEKPWLDRFCSLLAPRSSVLDIGCGSAEPIARFFIEQRYELVGVDASSALISACKTRFPEQEWIIQDMRTLSLDRNFNGLIAWDSFFHLSPAAQRGMFPIFRKHAGPRAALMFTSGPAHGEAVGTYEGEPLYHASLDGEEYRALLDENGFEVLQHMIEDPDCGRHTVWLTQLR